MANLQETEPTGRDGGDRYEWLGNRVSTDVDDSVERGMCLALNGDGSASAADAEAIDAAAVRDAGATPYDVDTIQLRGAVEMRVESSVSTGDRLLAGDTGGTGTAGVATSGGDRKDPLALSDARTLDDGNDYAVVHLG
jgi:hypothetical protein